MSFEKYSKECPVVAILRGITPPEMLQVCEVLYDAGIRLLEVPLNSPDACASIKLAADKYHADGKMLIGAGTVLSVEDVRNVAAAGGKFIISPDTNSEVIAETTRLGLISIPGFFTPTEAFAALRAGADYLKLFPAGVNGTGYIKDIKAVIKAPRGAAVVVITDLKVLSAEANSKRNTMNTAMKWKRMIWIIRLLLSKVLPV